MTRPDQEVNVCVHFSLSKLEHGIISKCLRSVDARRICGVKVIHFRTKTYDCGCSLNADINQQGFEEMDDKANSRRNTGATV